MRHQEPRVLRLTTANPRVKLFWIIESKANDPLLKCTKTGSFGYSFRGCRHSQICKGSMDGELGTPALANSVRTQCGSSAVTYPYNGHKEGV